MNTTRRQLARAGVMAAAGLLLAGLGTPVLAAAPPNDAIASPTVVGAVPYTDGPTSTTEATTGATDPLFCNDPAAGADRATVWYQFTPTTTTRYLVDTFGSSYDTTLYVGTADGTGGLAVVGCNDDADDLQSAVGWNAVAGTTYLITVGTCCGSGSTAGGGMLVLHLDVAPPAPVIDLTVSRVGSFSRYGVATIQGTVTCQNTDGQLGLDAFLTQPVGKRSINGGAFGDFTCSSTPTSWSIEIPGEDGKFFGGKTTVDVFAGACGPKECSSDFETMSVTLRH